MPRKTHLGKQLDPDHRDLAPQEEAQAALEAVQKEQERMFEAIMEATHPKDDPHAENRSQTVLREKPAGGTIVVDVPPHLDPADYRPDQE